MTTKSRRRRKRRRVLVERETCETAGDMEANLAVEGVEQQPQRFPYSNWGPWVAVLGVFLALGTGIVMGIPAAIIGSEPDGDLSTFGNVGVQLATVIGFLLVPMAIAAQRGAATMGEVLRRLGVRRFRPSTALKWTAAAIGAYLLFAMLYSLVIVTPEQEDIAEGFGALPVQILLIAIAAPIAEEVCFRGMLFGGLREKLPLIGAALLSGVIFGALHALTGISAVPPLIAFGFVLALLYEKTGSILPCILLHMLNNSVALLAQ
jgi:membrane protease YdiL (CAAX protease family)